METFWDHFLAVAALLAKVVIVLLAIDLISVVFEWDFRIPYLALFSDWMLSKL